MSQTVNKSRFRLLRTRSSRDPSEFASAVRRGLTTTPKAISPRFLYDAVGSQIFEEICLLPEYYLTRAERQILHSRAPEIATLFDVPITMAELGSGSSVKTRLLIEAFLARHGRLRYVPIDISLSILDASSRDLLGRYETLEITAIAGEYSEGIEKLAGHADTPKLILWLGSNIGNLEPAAERDLLRELRAACAAGDRLLIGADLEKDPAALVRAYDDSSGVTARFSLNILARINGELGGHFDLEKFRHTAEYVPERQQIEIHLVSLERQRIAVDALGIEVPFEAGDTIHVENSRKYSTRSIRETASRCGLKLARQWLDNEGQFSLNLLAPA